MLLDPPAKEKVRAKVLLKRLLRHPHLQRQPTPLNQPLAKERARAKARQTKRVPLLIRSTLFLDRKKLVVMQLVCLLTKYLLIIF
jgi:hypothetical protein